MYNLFVMCSNGCSDGACISANTSSTTTATEPAPTTPAETTPPAPSSSTTTPSRTTTITPDITPPVSSSQTAPSTSVVPPTIPSSNYIGSETTPYETSENPVFMKNRDYINFTCKCPTSSLVLAVYNVWRKPRDFLLFAYIGPGGGYSQSHWVYFTSNTSESASGYVTVNDLNYSVEVIGVPSNIEYGNPVNGTWTIKVSSPPDCFTKTPNCVGKVCGDDGCGGSCGTCSSGQTCSSIGKCTITVRGNSVTTCNFDNYLQSNCDSNMRCVASFRSIGNTCRNCVTSGKAPAPAKPNMCCSGNWQWVWDWFNSGMKCT